MRKKDGNSTSRPLQQLLPPSQSAVLAELSSKILNTDDIFATSVDNAVFDKLYSLIK